MNQLLHLNTPDAMSAQKDFSRIPEAQIQRSTFNRSHTVKTTLGSGFLVPFMVDEIYPGDTFRMDQLAAVIRMVTPLVPTMDNIYCDWFFFFVPMRLTWIHTNNFFGEQANPGDTTSYLIPTIDTTAVAITDHSPYDYMGCLPGKITTTKWISALYGRGFNLIYNKWFRDQNLQNSYTVPTGDGPDTTNTYQVYGVNSEKLPRRGKRHDYFTSCLPWPQKINDGTVVSIPLGTTAPVIGDGVTQARMHDNAAHTGTLGFSVVGGVHNVYDQTGTTNNGAPAYWGDTSNVNTGLLANLAAATAATINQLRLAFTMQQLFERDARGGTYLPEIIKNHFGVISPDSRLQWPEYIGGGETPIQISAVPQTGGTGAQGTTTPQGYLTAFAAGQEAGRISWVKSFVEHGFLYGLMSIRADLTYQAGIPRKFGRSTRYSLYWPTFANLGEQAVNNYEIYHQGTAADFTAFGYQEAWAELRYYPNEISAGMRSTAPTSFAIWHLSQQFTALPTLSATFIEDTPPINRAIAVTSTYDQFYADIFVDLKCTRPLPVNSVPGLTRL